MKKNKAMRAAGALFVATMLSTSIVSGTYAKYVTSDSASDTARVAIFGVEVKSSGALYSNTYTQATSNEPGAQSAARGSLSVISKSAAFSEAGSNGTATTAGINGTDKVVAPGTQNTTGLTFAVTGTPEVKVQLNLNVTGSDGTSDPKDVFLKKGTYPDMTTGVKTDSFSFDDKDYHPIVYTLTYGSTSTTTIEGSLEEIETKLESLTQTYDAGTDLSTAIGTIKLTWKWAFEDTTSDAAKKLRNQKDTLLGDLAARDNNVNTTIFDTENTAAPESASGNYCLDTDVKIEISVTQVD